MVNLEYSEKILKIKITNLHINIFQVHFWCTFLILHLKQFNAYNVKK